MMTTKIKERPIVLTAQEVNAVLAGDKTQHRVPVLTSEQVAAGYKCCYGVASGQVIFTKDESDKSFVEDGYINVECALGSIGDRLWVREFHARTDRNDHLTRPHYYADGTLRPDLRHDAGLLIKYSAEDMPRWASRLLLEITDICIERVQDISEAEIQREFVESEFIETSISPDGFRIYKIVGTKRLWSECVIQAFKSYWDSIYGKGAWDRNDWVWVIEFKVIKENDDD